jgi:cytochrome c2
VPVCFARVHNWVAAFACLCVSCHRINHEREREVGPSTVCTWCTLLAQAKQPFPT